MAEVGERRTPARHEARRMDSARRLRGRGQLGVEGLHHPAFRARRLRALDERGVFFAARSSRALPDRTGQRENGDGSAARLRPRSLAALRRDWSDCPFPKAERSRARTTTASRTRPRRSSSTSRAERADQCTSTWKSCVAASSPLSSVMRGRRDERSARSTHANTGSGTVGKPFFGFAALTRSVQR